MRMQPEIRVGESHTVILNSIPCHSVPQIAALVYRECQVVRLPRQRHEGSACVASAAASRDKVRTGIQDGPGAPTDQRCRR